MAAIEWSPELDKPVTMKIAIWPGATHALSMDPRYGVKEFLRKPVGTTGLWHESPNYVFSFSVSEFCVRQRFNDFSQQTKALHIYLLTYSPGAIIKKGDQFVRCNASGKWKPAKKADMGPSSLNPLPKTGRTA